MSNPTYYWNGDIALVKYPGNAVGSPVSKSKVQDLIDQGLLKNKDTSLFSGMFGSSKVAPAEVTEEHTFINPMRSSAKKSPLSSIPPDIVFMNPMRQSSTPPHANQSQVYNERRASIAGHLTSVHSGDYNNMIANLNAGIPARPNGSNWGELTNANKQMIRVKLESYKGGKRNKKTRVNKKGRKNRTQRKSRRN
jgi:hypothetical protein